MKVIERFKVNKPPEGPRTFTFQLSGAGLASVVVVGALCLVWVFILGVLVGRGYKPEAAVPELAQMMPSAPAPAAPEQKEPPTVLKPEELQFMESLQGKKPAETVTVDSSNKPGDKAADQAAAQTITPPPTSSLEKTPAPLPKGRVATAAAQPDRKTVASSESRREKSSAKASKDKDKDKDKKSRDTDKSREKSKDPKKSRDKNETNKKSKDSEKKAKDSDKKSNDKEKDKKSKDTDKSSKRYRVTYQIASIEDRKQAERESDRLNKMGMNCHVEEAKVDGKTVYRVILRLKGAEGDIKSTLNQAGAKKPIQRYKKAL